MYVEQDRRLHPQHGTAHPGGPGQERLGFEGGGAQPLGVLGVRGRAERLTRRPLPRQPGRDTGLIRCGSSASKASIHSIPLTFEPVDKLKDGALS